MKAWISEFEAYALAVIGVIADQLTTRLAISNPYIFERNPNVIWLMEKGLWAHFDAALLIVSIGISAVIMRKWKFYNRWVILLFFVVGFVLRFGAAMNNLCWLLLW